MIRHMNIPVFIPHEGCPNSCIFCNQKKISGQLRAPTPEEIENIIQEHLKTVAPEASCEIAFFGGSFTALPQEEQRRYLEAANRYVEAGRVSGIRLSTRPDYVDEEILRFLREYAVKTIELGIQSLDGEVLKSSGRSYSPDSATAACQRVKDYGFSLGIQTMIGLPGDTLEKSLDTAKRVIGMKPDMIRIYPTLVIRETGLEEEFRTGRYLPLSLETAVFWCSQLIPLYEEAEIKVLRIGLQHTVDLNPGKEVLGGPVHPAFGELVYSRIWLDQMIRVLDNIRNKTKGLHIHVFPTEVSQVIGQHRRNIEYLKKRYGFTEIQVSGDSEFLKAPGFDFRA